MFLTRNVTAEIFSTCTAHLLTAAPQPRSQPSFSPAAYRKIRDPHLTRNPKCSPHKIRDPNLTAAQSCSLKSQPHLSVACVVAKRHDCPTGLRGPSKVFSEAPFLFPRCGRSGSARGSDRCEVRPPSSSRGAP